ncbi:ATP-binding protein [Novispirillum itersonii]|uniref:histidine kinase n=1 Tax=Novispirillum itersonii TaxID=189 RepID=A0A7X0DNE1_NOVIT|nr:ATP-binding protein [Novispirillum itersonii]MBB6211890.1 putative ATPase/signal transduction histidine kinase/GAF domain-containing protein [Novispirillum itersonii]
MPYVFDECLHVGGRFAVWRGWLRADDGPGRPVILKLPADAAVLTVDPEETLSELTAQLSRQHDVLWQLSGAGAPPVLALETSSFGVLMANGTPVRGGGPVLVMADTGARVLRLPFSSGDKGPPGHWDEAAALRFGIGLMTALGPLHRSGLVLGGLHPSHVLLDPDGQVRLIGQGAAAPAGELWQRYGDPPDSSCVAPELTGFLQRPVDLRADYYSSGVLLYALLTGRLPFGDTDPQDLLHAHLGRTPEAPDVLDSRISAETAQVVMRLLEKDPDRRYQRGSEIRSALEHCLGSLREPSVPSVAPRRHRTVETDPAGDLPGRRSEQDSLRDALLHAMKGRGSLQLIRAASGGGKSALLEAVSRCDAASSALVVRGQFDSQQGHVPFGVIMTAFSRILRQNLAGGERDLRSVRTRLEAALGRDDSGPVWMLTAAMPPLSVLIGHHQAPSGQGGDLPGDAFRAVFVRFLQALLEPGQVLLLILDDLHHADRSTLDLLLYVLQEQALRAVVVVASLPDGTVEQDSPAVAAFLEAVEQAAIPVRTLCPGPLTAADALTLLERSFVPALENGPQLAELCIRRTFGNPLFLQRFIATLHERRVLRFDGGADLWRWDPAMVPHLPAPESLIGFLAQSLREISPFTRTVLQVAACIGMVFDPEEIRQALEVQAGAVEGALRETVAGGLVMPLGEGGHDPEEGAEPTAAAGGRFRFQHDRIRDMVGATDTEDSRARRHASLGRIRLAALGEAPSGPSLFRALDQINAAAAEVYDPAEQDRMARLNLQAARTAMASAGFSSALSYARSGIGFLGAEAWQHQPALCLDLHVVAAEAAYVLREWADLDRSLDRVLAQPLDPLDTTRATELRVLSLSARTDPAAAVDAALRGATALGYPVSSRLGGFCRLAALIRLRLTERFLADAPGRKSRADNPRAEAALRLLLAVSAARHISRPDLAPVYALRVIELALRIGDCLHLGYAHAMLTSVCASRGDREQAFRLASRGITLLRESPGAALKARALLPLYYLGLHWQEPLQQTRRGLLDCHRLAMETGDTETAAYALAAALEQGVFSGVSLRDLGMEATRAAVFLRRYPNAIAGAYVGAVSRFLVRLTEPGALADPVVVWTETQEDIRSLLAAGNPLVAYGTLLLTVIVLTAAEAFPQAMEALAAADPLSARAEGTVSRSVQVFYGAFVGTRLADRSGLRRRRRRLRQAIRQFEVWTAECPVQHLHRLLLLRAEDARISDSQDASDLYARALQAARDNGNTGEEVLVLCAAAAFHEQGLRTAVAGMLRRQVFETLDVWGAAGLSERLRTSWRETPDGLWRGMASAAAWGGASPAGTPAQRRAAGQTDLMAVVRAAQAISGEIHRPDLLERLMRITMGAVGAQRGVLLLKGASGWVIEVDGEAESDRFLVHRMQIPVNDDLPADFLPFSRGIFNFVIRSGETVVLENAVRGGDFTADPYVTRVRPLSVLAMPLYQRGDLTGVLYLENNLVTGLFTTDRLEVLRLLAAQVMVSLENSQFYENMAALNRDLERQVEERSREATEKTRLLEATLDNMSDGLILFDAEGRMMVWNNRAMELFGFPPALQRRGVSQAALISSTIASGVLSERLAGILMERAAAGRSVYPDKLAAEVELAGDLHIQVRRRFMADGGEVQIYLDVTEERRRERELMQARRDAEAALEDLRSAQDSLIQAEKMASLGELVAGVAHEINTPVGITLTAASFLSERTRELSTALTSDVLRRSQLQQYVEQAAETTALMETNIRRAADLITSFKQIAVDQSSGDRRRFNVEDYLWEVIRSFTPMLRKAGHTLSLSCPQRLVVESYPGAWSQILTNFVTNSIDHAFLPGQHGRLRVVVSMPQPGIVEMVYSDDGRGIPADVRNRIFDPFFTTRRGVGGSGLGLHIVFNLVTGLLHGSVVSEENPGGGTRMVVRVPVAVVPVITEQVAADSAPVEPV